MALLPVVKYGDPILRKKVDEVSDFSELDNLINDMFETMYNERGIGLAANQVGVSLAILVFDISHYEIDENTDNEESFEPNPRIFINPKIIDSVGECSMEEGCLSVPEIRANILRPETITLQYYDLNKNKCSEVFSGLAARVILHEIDHLNGKFFTDYLSTSKRMLIHKRLQEIAVNGSPSTGIILP